ncbi:MAG: DUF11 domain-containing protein [Acidobacteriota bacterium]|nr:DUF11 domain-containing protein [Acidobacteriota bacterium]
MRQSHFFNGPKTAGRIFFLVCVSFFTTIASAQTRGTPGPDLTVLFSPDTVGTGGVSRLSFTIENTTGGPIEDVAFTENLPAGMTLADPANPVKTCLAGTLSAPDGGTTISLVDGLLGIGETCVITVSVTATATGTVSTFVSSDVGNSATEMDDLTVDPTLLRVSKAFSPDSIIVGERSTLTFTVDNTGSGSLAAIIAITDNLPAGMEIADPANITDTCSGVLTATPGTSLISYSSGILNGGATCTIAVDVVATGLGDLVNLTENITYNVFLTSFSAGLATDTLEVTTPDDLLLTKEFLDDPAAAGGTVDLQFTLLNRSRSETITNISFTDDLDATLTGLVAEILPTDPVGAGSTVTGTDLITLSGGTLAAGESASFTVTCRLPGGAAAGSYPNSTSVVSGTIGGGPAAGNAASDTLFVPTGAPPLLTLNFSDDPVEGGDNVSLDITITNQDGVNGISDLTFTLPINDGIGGFTINTVPAGCGGVFSPLFTGSPASLSGLRLTGGSLAGGASCMATAVLSVPIGTPSSVIPFDTASTVGLLIPGEPISGTILGSTVTGADSSADLIVISPPQLSKTFADPVITGGTTTLTYTIRHDAGAVADAEMIAFTDDLDAVFTGLVATGGTQNDICGTGSSVSDGSTVTFSGGTLMPGEECEFSVTLSIPSDASGSVLSTTSTMSSEISSTPYTSAAASDTLDVVALDITMEVTDDPVPPDGTATLEFTIDNVGLVNADTITFTLNTATTLSGLTIDPASLPVTPCGAGSTATLLPGNQLLIFAGGIVNAGNSCNFSVDLLIPSGAAEGSYVLQTASPTANIGGIVVLPVESADLDVFSPLSISKSFVGSPAAPGDQIDLEITLSNSDLVNSVTGIGFTDDLDAALTGLVATGLPISVCGGTLSGTGLLTFTGGVLAADSDCTITVTLDVPVGATGGSTVTNTTSTVTGTSNSVSVSGDPASADFIVGSLMFTKVFDGDTTPTGEPVITFTFTNTDPLNPITDITFTDDLDALITGMTKSSADATDVLGTGSSLTGTSTITLADGRLEALETLSFDVTVSVPDGTADGTYTNTTSILSGRVNGGPVVTAPAATADLTVNPSPTFDKSFGTDPIAAGETSTITFTIDNSGSTVAISSIDFTDNLPAGLEVASPNNASTTCTGGTLTATAGSGTISYSGGSLGAGASCTITVDITSSTAGDYTNTTGNLTSSGGTSGTASDTLRVNPQPGFSKAFSPMAVAENEASTLTFTIDNTGSTAGASSLAFTDNLPAGLVIATPANAVDNCSGSLTANAGDTTITFSGGVVPASSSCTITVDVSGSSDGDYNNTSGDLTSSLGNSGTASDSLRINPPPGFTKAFSPDTIIEGGTSTLTFTIDNTAGTATATGAAFTDTLPSGLLIASPSNASSDCGGTLTATAGTDTIDLSGGSIAAMSSCTISVDVTGSTFGDYNNTSGDLTTSLNTSTGPSDTLRINPPPGFSKAFASDPIFVNGTSTLTFTIDNTSSTVAASSLDFTDTFPANLVIASPANTSSDCGGSLTATAGTDTVDLSGGSVAASSSCTISVDVTSAVDGDYTNTSGDLTSSLGNSGTASDTLRVNPAPVFTKVFSPDVIAAGETSTITFTIDNTSSTAAVSSLAFSDTLPTGLEVASPNNASTTCTGGTLTAAAGGDSITYSGGSLAASSSCTVTVDVTTLIDGDYTNTTSDLSTSAGTVAAATDDLRVNPQPGFSKAFSPTAVAQDEASTLTFTIDNTGSTVDATSLAFTDGLPSGLVIATPANAVDNCSGSLTANAGDTTITFTGGTATAGADCTITVDISGSSAGDYTNTSGDLTSSLGNSGTATDDLRINPPLGFSKAFAPNPIAEGEVSTLTFSIDNSSGTVTATSVDFSDTFPSGLVIASPANASSDCGGSLTATAGTDTVSLSGGSIAAMSTCSISVDVTSSTEGDYANVSGNLTSSLGDSGTASDSLRVNAPPGFSKAFSLDPIYIDEVTTLTFTIDNSSSTAAATSLDFADTLPANLVIASPSNASTTCSGGTLTATAGTDTVSYSGGSIAASSSCTVTVDITSSTVGDYTNTSGDLTSSLGNSGTASDTLRVNSLPALTKTFTPDTTVIGGVVTLQINIDNTNSTVGATGLAVTDNLPAGLTIANPNNASDGCGGTLTAVSGTSVITYTGGTLAASAGCDIFVDVTPSVSGDLVNTTSDLTSDQGTTGSATDTLRVNPPPGFTKAFAPVTIPRSTTSTLTFTIDNTTGTVDVTALDFTDTLPANVVIDATPNVVNTCTGGTVTAVAGTGTISYTGGTVSATSTCTLSVDVTSDTSGDYTNTSGDLTSDHGNSGGATAMLRVNPPPLFSKAFSVASAIPDEVVTLTFTIDNTANTETAASLAFTDNMPANMTVADTPNVNNTCGGTVTATAGTGVISLASGSLASGATCTIAVDVSVSEDGPYTNLTGDLTSDQGNSGTATDDITIIPVADLVVSIVDSPDPVQAGDTLTYTVTIDNNGPDDALDVVLTNTVPVQVTLDSTSGCVEDPAGAPTCTLGTIAAGGSAIVTLTGTVSAAFDGNITFDASVVTSTTQINTGDETDSEDTTVGREADLLTAVTGPTEANPADELTFTVVFDNTGPSDVFGADITADFPAEFSGVSWTCVPSAGSTCTAGGSGNIAESIDLAQGGNVTYTVTATVTNVAGTFSSIATITAPGGVTKPPTPNNTSQIDTVVTSPAEVTGIMFPVFDVPRKAALTVDVNTGDTLFFQVTLTNVGTSPQLDDPTSDEFTNVLPPGLSLVDATILSGGGVINPDVPTNTVTWNGLIPAGGSINLEIETTVNAGTEGNIIRNQGIIRYDADGDGINESTTFTDDPSTGGSTDPVIIYVIIPVPTLQTWGQILLVLSLIVGALIIRRRNGTG